MTLLLFIARLFRPFRATQVATWVFIAVLTVYYVPVLVLKMRICLPIAAFWDPDPDPDPAAVAARCLDEGAIFIADTITSAISDMAILLLPVPATLSLRMPAAKKLRMWLMLCVGGFAVLASFVRLYLVVKIRHSRDTTVDFVRLNLLG